VFYAYVGRDVTTAEIIKGTLAAESVAEAVETLRNKGLRVSKLVVQRKMNTLTTPAKKARIAFFRGYATLASTGMQNEEIVEFLTTSVRGSGQGTLRILKAAMVGIQRDVQRSGMTIAQAMSGQPRLFTTVDVSIIQTAIEAGKLVETLEIHANQLEQQLDFDSKFKSALIQPGIGFVAALLVFPTVCASLGPVLQSMFLSFKIASPPTFDQIAWVGWLARTPYLWIGYAAAGGALFWANRTGALQPYLRKLPMLGEAFAARATETAARTFAQAYGAGKSPATACAFAAMTVEDPTLSRAFQACSEALARGTAATVSEAMEQQGDAFDPLFVQYIKMARNARIPEMCGHVVRLSQRTVSDIIDRLPAVLNAAAMTGVGGLVGLMAFYVYYAISFAVAHVLSGSHH
jgi:type II secretory pathway component PulF